MKTLILLFLLLNSIIINSQNKNMEYEYDQEKLNNAGQREGELIHTYDENIGYKHIYKNGKLVEATNYRLTVEGQKPLIGKYKDGNPFEGYFVYANEMEIPLIDYYENGVFMVQYTCPLLDLLQNEGQESQLKWTKTIYKNNKPWEGLYHKDEYNVGGAHLFASEYYKNGLIMNVDLWLMAMHYAELIKLKFLPNGYTIYKEKMPDGGDPEIDRNPRSITVHFKDSKSGNVLFEVENKLVCKYQFSNADLSQKIKPVPGNVSYSFNDSTLTYVQRHDFETNKKLYNEAYGYNQNIIAQIFMGLDNQPIPYFTPDSNNDYSRILQLEKGFNSNAILYLRENGNPSKGFFIEKEAQSNKYKYTQYLDSKIVKKGDALTFESIKKIISDSLADTENINK